MPPLTNKPVRTLAATIPRPLAVLLDKVVVGTEHPRRTEPLALPRLPPLHLLIARITRAPLAMPTTDLATHPVTELTGMLVPAARVAQVLAAAGAEVVQAQHARPFREQRVAEVGAEEAGAAGDEDVARRLAVLQ